jgi:hypothetical protein
MIRTDASTARTLPALLMAGGSSQQLKRGHGGMWATVITVSALTVCLTSCVIISSTGNSPVMILSMECLEDGSSLG